MCMDLSLPETCSLAKPCVKRISKIIDFIVCPKQARSTYHVLKCHMGECSYGVKRFCCYPYELSFQVARTIKVKIFKDVETGTSERGKKKKEGRNSYTKR